MARAPKNDHINCPNCNTEIKVKSPSRETIRCIDCGTNIEVLIGLEIVGGKVTNLGPVTDVETRPLHFK